MLLPLWVPMTSFVIFWDFIFMLICWKLVLLWKSFFPRTFDYECGVENIHLEYCRGGKNTARVGAKGPIWNKKLSLNLSLNLLALLLRMYPSWWLFPLFRTPTHFSPIILGGSFIPNMEWKQMLRPRCRLLKHNSLFLINPRERELIESVCWDAFVPVIFNFFIFLEGGVIQISGAENQCFFKTWKLCFRLVSRCGSGPY